MPVQPPGVWGIDLGQCGLKAIRLQEIDGQVVATAFDYVEHPKILSQPDADPDQLTREALDKFLSRNTLRGDIVAISVPGQSGLARFVKLPPVEEKKIADIVRFEAKQQIPFNLEEVVWDYQKIGSGVVTDGFAMETEIGLFAMKRDMVARYLQHFKDVGVDIHLVQMAPLALCNYVAFDLLAKDAAAEGEAGDKKCVVALDIGADSSNLVITDGERIIWQRPIPLGGNHFTRALTKDLKLTFAKAEHLKRNATKSPDLKKILAALKPVLNDFVGEVQRSLGYFTNTHRDAHIEYMVGLGNAFRLPGLQKFLSEKLQIEVKKLGKMERVGGDQVVAQQAFTENILTFAVAYGLALQGLKRARLQTNLLPHEIRVERLVKAKKPFAVAAAAALLLAGGGLALSYALEYRTYGHDSVKSAVKASNDAKKRADAAKKTFDDTKRQALEEEEAVKTIVAGQFERDNWPSLYKFISTSIPQPDGKSREYVLPSAAADDEPESIKLANIPEEFKKKYWADAPNRPGAMSGQEAGEEYRKRQIRGSGGEDTASNGSGELGAGVEDLIQFNIESIHSYYCDSLEAYWGEVKKSQRVRAGGANMVRPTTDFEKKPSGSGWIVAIKGWTYHHDGEIFIRNTLLENIAQLGVQKKKSEAAPADGAKDPAGKPPATPPTTPVAPPGVPGLPGQGGAEAEPLPDLGPVINHLSHAVLYQYTKSSAKGPFALLTDRFNDDVKTMALAKPVAADQGGGSGGMAGMSGGMAGMSGGMAGGAAGMSGGMAGGMAGGAAGMSGGMAGMSGGGQEEKKGPVALDRSGWAPLGSLNSGAGGRGIMGGMSGMSGMKGGGAPGAGSGSKTPMTMPGPGTRPTPPPGTPTGQPGVPAPGGTAQPNTSSADDDKGPKRTEFIILFIWKEPIPSDDLRGLLVAADGGGNSSSPGMKASDNNKSATPSRPRRSRGGRGGRGRGKGR